ncbi:tetratricopeptide repeat protein [Kitasatospora sp. NBC_00374]|uniref:AfsR/SARP family transcriptional regulator n=1 Tax=Kitasatospora sp. NBC_00374 TaxID=2975964 RepID=UPI003246CBA5
MDFRILGPIEVEVDGRPVGLGGVRQQIILAVLALEAERVVSVERLIDAVWNDSPPPTARDQIRICVSALRRRFAAAGHRTLIHTRAPGYLLALPEGSLDVHTYEDLVARARAAVQRDHLAQAADLLQAALAVWRGAALAGIPSRLVQEKAVRLEEARRGALNERLRLDLALGRHDDLLGELTALASANPFWEKLQGYLMLALYRSGRQADALDVYLRTHRALAEELGVSPGPELRRLHRDILARRPALDLGPGGRERSSGRGRRERGRQRGDGTGRLAVPRQLPPGLVDFVGRQDDARRIRDHLLAEPGTPCRAAPRVVAISGTAGVGKTSLAVGVAHQVRDAFPGGQLFANLDGHRDAGGAQHVMVRFLKALGVSERAIPDDPAERTEMYRDTLAEARVLIVLDNVLSAEPVWPLLPGSGGCAVITTSRHRMTGLPGVLPVDVGVLGPADAVELLGRVAGRERIDADRDATAQLVQQCGGLPVALRIAGARLASRPHWPVGKLVARLRSREGALGELVHDGLAVRSCFQETYDALSAGARRLFRRLAVLDVPEFPGWVAAPLCELDPGRAEDLLEILVDVRLVEVASSGGGSRPVRYRLHNLIRSFARERLDAEERDIAQEAALRRALGAWLALTEEAHRREYGAGLPSPSGDTDRWPLPQPFTRELLRRPTAWLESEQQALVAAVRQAAEHGLAGLCWGLALAAADFLATGGHLADWRRTAQAAVAVTGGPAGDARGHAAALYSLGAVDAAQGRLTDARERLERARALFAELGDRHGLGLVLRALGGVSQLLGDGPAAQRQWAQALAGLDAAGDTAGQAHVLCDLAGAGLESGHHRPAGKLLERALELGVRSGNGRVQARVRHCVSELQLLTGHSGAAECGFHQTLRTARDTRDRIGEAHALHGLGRVRLRQGRPDEAGPALQHALRIALHAGDRLLYGRVMHTLGDTSLAQGRTSAAQVQLRDALEVFVELGHPRGQSAVRDSLRRWHWATGAADGHPQRRAPGVGRDPRGGLRAVGE